MACIIYVTNEFMSCGIFLYFSAECNNGMVCKNGGILDLKTCKCTCQYGWTGDLCGKDFLLLLEFYTQSEIPLKILICQFFLEKYIGTMTAFLHLSILQILEPYIFLLIFVFLFATDQILYIRKQSCNKTNFLQLLNIHKHQRQLQ